MIQTQHFHSPRGCLSYILHDPKTKEAALIDPSVEIGKEIYLDFITSNNLSLKYIIETHTHADHVSCSKAVKIETRASIVRHTLSPSPLKDIAVEGNESLFLGDEIIMVIATPGHTDESISLYNGHEVFTGDTLLVGGTGRTDFQAGDSEALYRSLHDVIEKLPGETLVRPGHDYKGRNQAKLEDEIHMNQRMMMHRDEFIHAMNTHHPPKPELFEHAIRENSQ